MWLSRKNMSLLAVVLVPVFFIWHAANAYFGLIPYRYIGEFLFYYLSLALILYLLARWLTRDVAKAVCWTVLLLVIFFFWGAAADFIKKHAPGFFSSYRFLLPLTGVIAVGTLWILRRKKKPPVRTAQFLLLLFGFFAGLEAVTGLYKLINRQAAKNNLAFYNKPLDIPAFKAGPTSPDIFFIVFDEYASSNSLRQYLGYDNSALDSILTHNHFFIARASRGNYNATPFSIASTLNADYFTLPLDHLHSQVQDLLKAQCSLNKSYVPALLKKAGYTIKNYALCDLDAAPCPHEQLFDHDAWQALYDETLWARLQADIGWIFRKGYNRPPGALPDPRTFRPIRMNMENIEGLYRELSTQSDTPRFVFGHVLVPHDPYYFQRNGSLRAISTADENAGIRDSLYLQQLQYINKWIEKLAVLSNKPSGRPRVVIIEGDHGRRDRLNENIPYVYEKQFMNLSSYYFSGHDYSLLYDSISPVNSFRVVLNKYFQGQLPVLKDSTILLY